LALAGWHIKRNFFNKKIFWLSFEATPNPRQVSGEIG
jgi:hypothetical protein